jgi:hypothetical protein
VAVGEALRWAKRRYLGSVPSGGFGTYDEKAMIESTLYGLPMVQMAVGGSQMAGLRSRADLRANGDVTATVTFVPTFKLETGAAEGNYYAIDREVQASPGRPVQPRTSQVMPDKSAFDLVPHGAVLISATSTLTEGFNPLISRPVTDTKLSEPPFTAEGWFPAQMWTLNRLGDENRLVVVPTQFRGNEISGTLRRFDGLAFEVYYTDTVAVDYTPPIIWEVRSVALEDEADLTVHAEDTSGVQRVVMAYTLDGMAWRSRDLTYYEQEDRWRTHFNGLSDEFIYFVQAVDGAGNVTVTSNKGMFFEPTRPTVYLPLVLRE